MLTTSQLGTPDVQAVERRVTTDEVIAAARKAERLYPGVVGQVLATEIRGILDFPWLGFAFRPAKLMRAIQETAEKPHPLEGP